MKKLSAILSLLLIVGLFHQGVVFAEATKEKKPAKTNFTPKKKHGEAVVSMSKKAEAPAPVAPPPAVVPPPPPAPVASPSPTPSPAV